MQPPNPRRPDLDRRRLLWSSAALLAAGLGLGHEAAHATHKERRAKPTPTATPTPTPIPTPTAAPSPEPVGEIPILVRPREAWGAAPPVQPYVPHTPSGVLLHHSGAPWYGRPATEQYLRNLQAFHTGPEREWEDIAYHYLVDLAGGVWAGRPPEVRGNPSIYYDSTGFVLVCLLGDYTVQQPSEAQLAAASSVVAWLIRRFTLVPQAVGAHRDRAPTTCPGDNLYRLIRDGAFAVRVQALLLE